MSAGSLPLYEYEYGDKYINMLMEYMRNQRNGLNNTAMLFGPSLAIAQAYHIFHRAGIGGFRWFVEAFIMSGAQEEEIAKHIQMDEAKRTIRAYKKLFFDIYPYRNHKINLIANVMSMSDSPMKGGLDCDMGWKMLAYTKGVKAIKELSAFMLGKPFGADMRKWYSDITRDLTLYAGFNKLYNNAAIQFTQDIALILGTVKSNWVLTEDINKRLVEAEDSPMKLLNALADVVTTSTKKTKVSKEAVEKPAALDTIDIAALPPPE